MKGPFEKPLQKQSDKHLELEKTYTHKTGSLQFLQELILYKRATSIYL